MWPNFPDLPGFRERPADSPWADIVHRLQQQRIILISKEINDELANDTIAALLRLEADDPGQEIRLQINSPGASWRASLAIADVLPQLQSDVITICMGQAADASTVLLTAGTAGKRYALPHARIRLHHPNPTVAIKEKSARDLDIIDQVVATDQ